MRGIDAIDGEGFDDWLDSPWLSIHYRAEHPYHIDGLTWDEPTTKEIVDAIGIAPIPDWDVHSPGTPHETLKDYVARRLVEKRPRGRPSKRKDRLHDLWLKLRAYTYACEVALVHARFKRDKTPSPRRLAVESVAKAKNLAPSTLHDILKQGRREWGPPYSWDYDWPTLQLAQRVLAGEEVRGWWTAALELAHQDVPEKWPTHTKTIGGKKIPD